MCTNTVPAHGLRREQTRLSVSMLVQAGGLAWNNGQGLDIGDSRKVRTAGYEPGRPRKP
jgi:hypothetical protein